MNKMETVFDHNITEKEMLKIFGFNESKNEFLESKQTQRWHYVTIYNLYSIRGNIVMAKKYLDMIPNDVHKIFSTLHRRSMLPIFR